MEAVALGFCERTEIFHPEADTEGCRRLPDTMKQHEDDGMMTREQLRKTLSIELWGHSTHPIPAGGNSCTTRPHSERIAAAPASPATLTTGTWEMG